MSERTRAAAASHRVQGGTACHQGGAAGSGVAEIQLYVLLRDDACGDAAGRAERAAHSIDSSATFGYLRPECLINLREQSRG